MKKLLSNFLLAQSDRAKDLPTEITPEMMQVLRNMMKNNASVPVKNGKGNASSKGNGKSNGHAQKENSTTAPKTAGGADLSDKDFGKF